MNCLIWLLSVILIPLSAIDTLMQSQPDSALTVLLDEPTDEPYYQLLLSEALYKNDYAQTNRDELLAAMAYFDSENDPFLAARCHYMNGVGYYEMDSVVLACEEYMKAIQVMEEHYPENELVGLKAKFMALTYTRLVDIFSDQYLHEQAIFFVNQALTYYHMFDAEPWQISWMLNEIGTHYDMMGIYDSADCYYHKAIELLPDTNNLTYKMVSGHLAFLNYEKTTDKDPSLQQIYWLLSISESNTEYCARCLSIGEIYYHEAIYDSAWKYLNIVFDDSPSTEIKKQAAQWLAEICEYQRKYDEISKYSDFLIPFATQEEDNSTVKSQLAKTYGTYIQQRQDRLNKQAIRRRMRLVTVPFIGLLLALFVFGYLYRKNKRKKTELEKQFEEELFAHEMKQKALSGRLRRSNENLQELKEKVKQQDALKKTENKTDIPFAEEPICTHILKLCNDENLFIKTNISVSEYSDIALTDEQKAMLKQVAIKHYGDLFQRLKTNYPNLKEKDFSYFYLCLLGLNNTQIAALMQLSYSTIWKREKRLQHVFNSNEKISVILNGFLIH
ncbi:MAG: hypothetical protein IJL04_00585 [Bacteroidales bacterium]|nr:hypothetical protein [Bacteroidales bacterium]